MKRLYDFEKWNINSNGVMIMRKTENPGGETKDQDRRDTGLQGTNQPEKIQKHPVNGSIESGRELGEQKYNLQFNGIPVTLEIVAPVLKKNSKISERISGPVHWLNYLYSSDQEDDFENRMLYFKKLGVFRKHMHSLACHHSSDLMAESLLKLMKESSLVLAHVIDSSGSLNRILSFKQWKELVKEKSFRDLFDSPEVKKSIIKCHTTLGTESEADIQSTNCINYPDLVLDDTLIPGLLSSTTFADAFSRLSGGNQANLRDAIKDNAAKSKEDSHFSYFVTHFDVQPEEHDQVWSEHLYAQAETDPKILRELIRDVFGPSQDTGFRLSASRVDPFVRLLHKHTDEVTVSDCLPMIVASVYSEINRVLMNDAEASNPYEKQFEEILNVFYLFEFRLKLPGFDAVSAETSTRKFSELMKTLGNASNRLFSSQLNSQLNMTQSLEYCCKSWLTVDRIYDSPRLTEFQKTQKTKLEKSQLEVMRYALCCMQRLNLARHKYIEIAQEINLWNKEGSQPIDEISARTLIFICLASSAYLPSEQETALSGDEINYFLKLRFKDVFSSDEFRGCQGGSIVADFMLALQANVDKAVAQFRDAVSPLTITVEAMNELIQSVFRLDDQTESYATLYFRQMLDNLTEPVDFVSPPLLTKDGGRERRYQGETKSTQLTAEDQGACNSVDQHQRHDAGVLSQKTLDALNPPSIDRLRIDWYCQLIVARLKICGTKRTELVKEIITDLKQSIKNKLHTMEALESLLQRVKGDFWFYQKGSRLYQCICQSLKEVELCNLVVPTAVKPDSLVGAGMANSSSSLFFKQEVAQPFDQLKQHIPYNNL